ncbi:Enoyl-[acyl-carrier-protein] reductase [Pacificimonas flava]|uniref:Nitronate monooxygenase n=2 Tax=Pacificimonas flava TaxID=1234595 RepID=M2T5Q3_9SPHN|nr:Enoyl-[acyl-carrier-protein] reductase [Pacificimonas flava]
MAGVATPELAAAVCEAGGLGSIGVGATDADGARAMINATRALTDQPFNVNLFVHATAKADAPREQEWLQALRPLFDQYRTKPPSALQTIYTSFADDDAMLAMLVKEAPPIVSFHFGLPAADRITALKSVGCTLIASATSLDEARKIEAAGIDMIVAQGWEAGGHRGMFDPALPDDQLGTMALTRMLVAHSSVPVIAAGGIMDGAGIRAALDLGAVAAQLGTAFIACPESSADEAYRAALNGEGARHTVMTRAISGRPARCLANRFTTWAAINRFDVPDYPIAYDAGKALNAAARSAGESGFGAQWAGQGAPLHRVMSASSLVATLWHEAGQSN